MRAYDAASEEALFAREQLADWAGEGYLNEEQRRQLDADLACDLRTTNVFLRVVLFLFTGLIIAAAVGLCFAVLLSTARDAATGIAMLFFAAACYAGAELAVARARLYRHGIEEALAVASIAFLCAGLLALSPPYQDAVTAIIGSLASIWMWHRFGLVYAALGAMILAAWACASLPARPLVVAVVYAAALAMLIRIRPAHRHTALDRQFSWTEALLWFGTYSVLNLELESVFRGFGGAGLPRPLYWTTWLLIWCLPPVILLRGIRMKDRPILAAGAVSALLTLGTNKSYLGWTRHSWDLMLLGALLIGVALGLRRWLAAGPDETRLGFTARRLSGKDKALIDAAGTVAAVLQPTPPTPATATADPNQARFGGGEFGGGGASSDF